MQKHRNFFRKKRYRRNALKEAPVLVSETLDASDVSDSINKFREERQRAMNNTLYRIWRVCIVLMCCASVYSLCVVGASYTRGRAVHPDLLLPFHAVTRVGVLLITVVPTQHVDLDHMFGHDVGARVSFFTAMIIMSARRAGSQRGTRGQAVRD